MSINTNHGRPKNVRHDGRSRNEAARERRVIEHEERAVRVARLGFPNARDDLARCYRRALVREIRALGTDAGAVALAHSRASQETRPLCIGVHHKDSETVRLAVLTDVCAERGLDRLRGATHAAEDHGDDREALRVPRARTARAGDRVRRGGKR